MLSQRIRSCNKASLTSTGSIIFIAKMDLLVAREQSNAIFKCIAIG